ncbi:glycosyl hydrolase family 28-related protein [Amycolatopsis sp. NPDC021455]|uniref:glycosyl hydrolase family 28-related protein n=1 Tax=Amycolatopsis sp. NPDC021455 TaxID=3154901 RepID=UPI0033C97866
MKKAVVAVDVGTGDVLCPALDPADPAKLTRADTAALFAGTLPAGIAATSAVAGSVVEYHDGTQPVPAAVTGLAAGAAATVVVDGSGRCARTRSLAEDAFVLGHCDAAGLLTWSVKHTFANVKDFGARGDDSGDDRPAIAAAIRSLTPGRGTVYFPAGLYDIGRPLYAGGYPGLELRGESEYASTIRYRGHGPALCLSPEPTRFPTADALLSGPGGAGVLDHGVIDTLNLRDTAVLDLNGVKAFSIECTVRPDVLPAGTGMILSSSGRRVPSDPKNVAFSLFLAPAADGRVAVHGTARIGTGELHLDSLAARQDGQPAPQSYLVGQAIHIAFVFDGTELRLHTGVPGAVVSAWAAVAPAAADAKLGLTQAVEEGIYLGVQSQSCWPEFAPEYQAFTGRVDSLRISDFARRDPAAFTAPTAKFPDDDASNRRLDPRTPNKVLASTRLLVNFDQDVDVFTVGSSWYGSPYRMPVYLAYALVQGQEPGWTSPTVRRLELQAFNGAGIVGQRAVTSVIEHVRVTASRDGIWLRNYSYCESLEHLYLATSRLGLVVSNSGMANIKRLQTAGCLYDFAATHVVGGFARDWYIGNPNSKVPLLLTSQSPGSTFHGTDIVITSEGTPPDYPRETDVLTANMEGVVFESSVFETAQLANRSCPPVTIDYSRVDWGGRIGEGTTTFVNCQFKPSLATRQNIAFTGDVAAHPVRLLGNTNYQATVAWAEPRHERRLAFSGGCVSTTDTGTTQWQGTRDWVFALDDPTGRIRARERENQGTGTATGASVPLAALPLPDGVTCYRAEVLATDAAGNAAYWTLERGFRVNGGKATAWAGTVARTQSGSAAGQVPPGWAAPSISVNADGTGPVKIDCAAPAGVTLAFTAKLRALEGLSG